MSGTRLTEIKTGPTHAHSVKHPKQYHIVQFFRILCASQSRNGRFPSSNSRYDTDEAEEYANIFTMNYFFVKY